MDGLLDAHDLSICYTTELSVYDYLCYHHEIWRMSNVEVCQITTTADIFPESPQRFKKKKTFLTSVG